jgi:hypothetical protein
MTRSVLRCMPFCAALLSACSEQSTPTEVAAGSAAALVLPSAVSVRVVMSNLNSPRGMAWGPEGALYVTESGTATQNGPCTQVLEGASLVTRCFSGTGSVSRLWKGRQERVLSDLPSGYLLSNGFMAGPQDIDFQGLGNGSVLIGCGCDPSARTALGPAAALLGTVIEFNPSGRIRMVADITAFEGSHNPAGGSVDSNPFGVLVEGGGAWVVDAGGNSLLRLSQTGSISYVGTFPSTVAPPPFMQSEPVPTRVKRGPDGALYVSTLSGLPFLDGSAAIYRVVPGQPPQPWLGGFKAITDFDFAKDGSVYVVQFASGPIFFPDPGLLIHVAPGGARSVLADDLFHPTGVLAGPDGSVYVANRGSFGSAGEVLRYQW